MYNFILPKSSAIFVALTKSIQFVFKNSTPDPVFRPLWLHHTGMCRGNFKLKSNHTSQ